MKHYLRPTSVLAFAAGMAAGALIVAGIVGASSPAAGQLPDCATEILVAP